MPLISPGSPLKIAVSLPYGIYHTVVAGTGHLGAQAFRLMTCNFRGMDEAGARFGCDLKKAFGMDLGFMRSSDNPTRHL